MKKINLSEAKLHRIIMESCEQILNDEVVTPTRQRGVGESLCLKAVDDLKNYMDGNEAFSTEDASPKVMRIKDLLLQLRRDLTRAAFMLKDLQM
jgi:hypothetical protein